MYFSQFYDLRNDKNTGHWPGATFYHANSKEILARAIIVYFIIIEPNKIINNWKLIIYNYGTHIVCTSMTQWFQPPHQLSKLKP